MPYAPKTRAHLRLLGWSACLAVLMTWGLTSGCNRGHYRQQADREVQCLIESGSTDPRWPLDDYRVDPDRRSRFYDPYCADCPPMPLDDPTSHQLMRCVDGKKGYKHWDKYGQTGTVENPDWTAYLPLDEDGTLVLDRTAAMQTALLHSRDYQSEVEDLYLSALDVTFERFQFDTQFFGGSDSFFRTFGPLAGEATSSNRFGNDSFISLRKQFATGSELLVGVANSVVWEFSGTDGYRVTTPITLGFVQPLLRAAGRAVVLEDLTQSERDLLANIRQMERFRRGFYAGIVAGRAGVQGPNPGNVRIPSVSGGFSSSAGGFLNLLESQVRIRNLEANVAGNQDSLYQMEALFDANRVSPRSQVELIRQSLYDSQSDLLSERARYQASLDEYKVRLGLPPDLKIRIEDPLLDQFNLIDPELTETQTAMNELLQVFRDDRANPNLSVDWYDQLPIARQICMAQLSTVEQDISRLQQALPDRIATLTMLASRDEAKTGQIDPAIFDTDFLRERLAQLQTDYGELRVRLEATLDRIAAIEAARAAMPGNARAIDADARDDLEDRFTDLYDELLELSLLEAKARLDTVTLIPIELSAEEAFEIARRNRRDWMNARAALVDQWRLIEVAANDLKSDLDVIVDGRVDPLSNELFGGSTHNTTGSLRVGVEFDAPLTRLAERNNYRRTLLNFQQSRRAYYAFEDTIQQSLRDAVRVIRLSQIDFEVRRAAVFVAIARVDMTRLQLTEPPEKDRNSVGATTARDVNEALQALLRAQNNFLAIWVDYEAQRLNLDLDLGTMELDNQGLWIDPGPTFGTDMMGPPQAEPLPPGVVPAPVPPMAGPAPLVPVPLPPVAEPVNVAQQPRSVQSQRW